tara:strand:+ start:309 stop:506 length:198 start_codon:yes stop_codon:yes gene_type:complete
MPLTPQVETSLRDAQSNLRNALSYSARTEKPYVSKHIADMLAQIDAIIDVQSLIEKVENNNDIPF